MLTDEAEAAATTAGASADPYSPWHERDHWWLNDSFERELAFTAGGAAFPVRLQRHGEAWQLRIGDSIHRAAAEPAPEGRLDVIFDDVRERMSVTRIGETIAVRRDGETFRLLLPDPMSAVAEDDDAGGRLDRADPGPGHASGCADRA